MFHENASSDAIVDDENKLEKEGELDEDDSTTFKPNCKHTISDTETEETTTPPVPVAPPETGKRMSNGNRKPLRHWRMSTAIHSRLPEAVLTFTDANTGDDPGKRPLAIQYEVDEINKNDTSTLVPRTEDRNVLTSGGSSRKMTS